MSVFSYFKKNEELAKVHDAQYIRTANEPENSDTKPVEPANPTKPEAN